MKVYPFTQALEVSRTEAGDSAGSDGAVQHLIGNRNRVSGLRNFNQHPSEHANVALGGVAVQSSSYDSNRKPQLAIDGKPFSDYLHGSCTATRLENNPWWRLDMRGPYNISYIKVIRRSDCCTSDIQGAEILIGNSVENNGNNNPRCGVITVTKEINMVFNCNQMEGRYVNVFFRGHDGDK
ncbi:fucolectin-1-like [Micropterus salmoides]|uniref:fucolectin-1-like n=1 Tax=Micropterus salmoides TaxID=27706 RepID=UPI0018EB4EF2|nr:fucolectin-1-like [Micropterus salmoides]